MFNQQGVRLAREAPPIDSLLDELLQGAPLTGLISRVVQYKDRPITNASEQSSRTLVITEMFNAEARMEQEIVKRLEQGPKKHFSSIVASTNETGRLTSPSFVAFILDECADLAFS